MSDYQISVAPNYYEAQGEDGPYTAVNYAVTATHKNGEVFLHFKTFSSGEEADGLVARIEAHLRKNKGWAPQSEHWRFLRRVYGSNAYVQSQTEEEAYSERLDVESEFGAGTRV